MNGKVGRDKAILARIGVEVKEKIIPHGEGATSREILKNRSVRNALIVVGLCLAFQQITGINIILYHGPCIYKYIGLQDPELS